MPRQHRARKHAPQWTHEEAQDALLAYMYGRLTPAEDAALEAHIDGCRWCRADGLRHIAAERHHLHQQRPKKPRRATRRAGMAVLCAIFGLVVGLGGFASVMVMHPSLLLRTHRGQVASPTLVPSATPPPTTTPVPTLAAGVSIAAAGVLALAWSPDGITLATATNSDTNGVTRYTQGNQAWTATRCVGGDGTSAPGVMAWSPDGARLAGAGRTRIILWGGKACQATGAIALPPNAGTDLYVFDTATGAVMQSAPATLFAATGYLAWSNGKVQSAASSAVGSFALWDGSQGVRLYRDAQGALWLGAAEADQVAHAAWLRWSPDGRYLLWGYPRVALSAAAAPTDALTTALLADVPAARALMQTVAGAGTPQGGLTLWLTADHTRLLVADGTQSPAVWTLRAAQSGATVATLAPLAAGLPARNGLDWRRDGTQFVRAAEAVTIFPAP